MLDDWLNRPVAQRIRTASDNSTSGYVEDQEPHPNLSNSQEQCLIVISSSDNGETDDEVEGDNCPPKTDCSESEPLFTPSTRSKTRSSPAVPVCIEEMDDLITVQDCHGTCCKVDMNFPFSHRAKRLLVALPKVEEILCANDTNSILG